MLHNKRPLIQFFRVSKRYGSNRALTDLTFDIHESEFVLITGPSGAGKSTLLKLIYLATPLTEGSILFNGINLSRIKKSKIPFLRRMVGVVFQDFCLIPAKTVYDNIAIIAKIHEYSSRMLPKKVNQVLRMVGMEDKKSRFPQELSGGEQQLVAIARALVGDPKIILADEPTGSLDDTSGRRVLDLFVDLNKKGVAILVATHNSLLTRNHTGKLIQLDAGNLVQTRASEQYISDNVS